MTTSEIERGLFTTIARCQTSPRENSRQLTFAMRNLPPYDGDTHRHRWMPYWTDLPVR